MRWSSRFGRDVHGQRAVAERAGAAAGSRGRDRDDLAGAAARVARGRAHKLPERRARHGAQLACPVAAPARLDRRAGLGARDHHNARTRQPTRTRRCAPLGRGLGQRHLDGDCNVTALHRHPPPRPPKPNGSAPPKNASKMSGERTEAREARSKPRSRAPPSRSVVRCALLGVQQHLCAAASSFELLLAVRVRLVDVGVQLARLGRNAFDVALGRVATDA